MDELTELEVNLIIQNLKYNDRISWEQTRQIMFTNVVPYSKKKISPEDVCRFPWDEGYTEPIKWTKENLKVVEQDMEDFKNFIMQHTNG